MIFMASPTLRTSPARLLSAVRSISSFVALRATSIGAVPLPAASRAREGEVSWLDEVLKHVHPDVAGANGEDLQAANESYRGSGQVALGEHECRAAPS